MMKRQNVVVFAIFMSLAVGCAGSQQPAPGTAPEDMSSEEHRSEADKHDEMAEEHEDEASDSQKGPQKHDHKKQAAEHSDVADQHEDAADEAAR